MVIQIIYWVVGIGVVVCGAVGTMAVCRYRITETDNRVKKHCDNLKIHVAENNGYVRQATCTTAMNAVVNELKIERDERRDGENRIMQLLNVINNKL